MIVRQLLQCGTCHQRFLFRISIGHERERVYSYKCDSCGLPVSFTFYIDQKNVGWEVEPRENAEPADGTSDNIVVNIHPDWITPNDKIHDPSYSPLGELHKIGDAASDFIDRYNSGRFRDYYAAFSYGRDLIDDFCNRMKSYELSVHGRKDLADKCFHNIKSITGIKYSSDKYLNALIDIAIAITLPSGKTNYDAIRKFYKRCTEKSGSSELKRYVKKYQDEHTGKFISSIQRFFKSYNELWKVLIYVRSNVAIINAATSACIAFDDIKKVYGDGFEDKMDLAIVPAISNNFFNSRRYDCFETMDLAKYMTIDKAGKLECIKENHRVNFLCKNNYSQLRNGSHHGSIDIDFSRGRDLIVYKSGRPPTPREIKYIEYLEYCVKIHFDIFHMFAAESIVFLG